MYKLPNRRLISQDDASITERADVPRSRFTGSWTRKTTFDAGWLVPFMVDEILPGDHMRYDATAYIRMATPLFPLFDNQRIDTFFFFVPTRLVWANWHRFMGEQPTPTSPINWGIPQLVSPASGYLAGGLFDHFGLPVAPQIASGLTYSHSVLPLRAYNLIYNEWFRDQNLINSVPFNDGDGPDVIGHYELRRRAKSHDYFTSALPWPQKFTTPSIPIQGMAPVTGIGSKDLTFSAVSTAVWETSGANPIYAGYSPTEQALEHIFKRDPVTGYPAIYADLSLATGVAVNAFRQAFLIQSMLERDARGGTRYVEILKSHFGVTSPDFRLQRPEYIGGGQTALQLTPIAQTAPTAGVPLGALGAAGTSVGQHSANFAATEHGYIIGLINVRTELSYQQGMARLWSRLTRYDFYWPSLAGLGEQAIYRKEIFLTGNPVLDELVFGYQESWHSYRTRYSEVTGLMRSGGTPTLDPWHLGQYFVSAPLLNETFIEENPPMARVLAAGDLALQQQYLADIMISRSATRPIPSFGTPAMLGRF